MSALDAQAIAVLGCAVRPGGQPSPALLRRCELAARLYRGGVAPIVVASGGRAWGQHLEAVVMKRLLVEEGVAEGDVVMELRSLSTFENGHYSARLLRARGVQRVVVATCAWHLPRALRNFRRFGVDALPPPDSWLDTPQPPTAVRVRETICRGIDALLADRFVGLRRAIDGAGAVK